MYQPKRLTPVAAHPNWETTGNCRGALTFGTLRSLDDDSNRISLAFVKT